MWDKKLKYPEFILHNEYILSKITQHTILWTSEIKVERNMLEKSKKK